MASSYAAVLSGLSSKERQAAERAIKDRDSQRLESADALEREATKVMEGLRRARQKLLGADGLNELRWAMQRERLRYRDRLQPPQGLGLSYVKENKARLRRGNTMLRKLGASPEELKETARAADARLRELLSASDATVTSGYNLEQNLQEWLELSPLHSVALPWGMAPDTGEPDPYPWVLFRPPFFGFDMHFVPQASDNFVSERELTLIPGSGLVGQVVTMDCNDAGDFDYASGTADTAIAFGYEPPTAGVIQVLIDAQNIACTHDLRMADEWGWSDGWAYQHNSLMLDVLHPDVAGPSLALMSEFGKTFDDDASYHQENLTFGQHYFAFLESAGSVPAGETVVIEVGTRSFDIARANDIEVHSRSEFLWLINSIEVRVAP